MTKKTEDRPVEPEENGHQLGTMQKRWYWIRTALITVLVFILVMYYTYPTRGNIAILWSAGLAAAILLLGAANYRGARLGSAIQGLLTVLKVSALLLVMALALFASGGSFAHLGERAAGGVGGSALGRAALDST